MIIVDDCGSDVVGVVDGSNDGGGVGGKGVVGVGARGDICCWWW